MAKKLIEVALPLKEINEASAREKSIRHGHPSTLHLWWARRPLATARAVLFASLVDDPSEHTDRFPTVELQKKERDRLFDLIKELVQWENSSNQELLNKIRAEIIKSVGEPPHVLDPFAGGGTIPLEAQRLGLHAHASDLNPVAVLINKAMIELPARFANRPPQNPDAQKIFGNDREWFGARGLAADVEFYGQRLKQLAQQKIGHLYPTVETNEGQATVIAWIWARTVRCNNPACEAQFPLAHSFVLSKKQNAAVKLILHDDRFEFDIVNDQKNADGTITRLGAKCPFCGANVKFEHIRAEGKAGRLGARLMAIVAEGKNKRIYLPPNTQHINAADIPKPDDSIDAPLPDKALGFRVQEYGLLNYNQLFTNRQLTALTTFSDLISTVRDEIINDTDNKEYADAVATYLAILVNKLADRGSSICSWDASRDGIRNTFGRQAIPMIWVIAETNPFSNSSGCFDNMLEWISKCVRDLPINAVGESHQHDALKSFELSNVIISTDPPYYDLVAFSDLSDFFYVWLRRSLRKIYPKLLMRMLPPKEEELLSDPYRQGDANSARNFFEKNMLVALKNIYEASTVDYPTTIFYAYKQDDAQISEDRLSPGWETMLRAIIDAGFIIVGTLPFRTELLNRMRSHDSNALSTSIVIVCRKPPEPKPTCAYNKFFRLMDYELGEKLKQLQEINLSPVDMAQAAIGPGMEIYSRYSKIQRGDGRLMDVRSALRLINKGLDDFLNAQDADLDNATKFCVELYKQTEFEEIKFGSAQLLATAKNVSLTRLKEQGLIESGRGLVRLLKREEMTDDVGDCVWALLQRSVWWFQEADVKTGVNQLLKDHKDKFEPLKRLAYRLYNIADQKHQTEEAQYYSQIVDDWNFIMSFVVDDNRAKAGNPQQTLDGM